jgi:hypothetical protein
MTAAAATSTTVYFAPHLAAALRNVLRQASLAHR